MINIGYKIRSILGYADKLEVPLIALAMIGFELPLVFHQTFALEQCFET